jgi:hypothetical protein
MPHINRTLRPFRDYDEKDVLNFASITGTDLPVNKGTLVKLARGLQTDQEPLEMLGNYGDFSVSNTVLQRYGVIPKVQVSNAGENPLGMTLFDVRETDENGELLKYRPRKAAEMEAVLSGQAIPLVTRGIFQYSGGASGTITPGAVAYAGDNGHITPYTGAAGANKAIGKFLGPTGVDGSVFVWLNIQNS